MGKNYDVITFFQKIFLRRPGVAIFADIIKIVTIFIKTSLKDSRKVRRFRSYVSKWNLYLYIWNLYLSNLWRVCVFFNICFCYQMIIYCHTDTNTLTGEDGIIYCSAKAFFGITSNWNTLSRYIW